MSNDATLTNCLLLILAFRVILFSSPIWSGVLWKSRGWYGSLEVGMVDIGRCGLLCSQHKIMTGLVILRQCKIIQYMWISCSRLLFHFVSSNISTFFGQPAHIHEPKHHQITTAIMQPCISLKHRWTTSIRIAATEILLSTAGASTWWIQTKPALIDHRHHNASITIAAILWMQMITAVAKIRPRSHTASGLSTWCLPTKPLCDQHHRNTSIRLSAIWRAWGTVQTETRWSP